MDRREFLKRGLLAGAAAGAFGARALPRASAGEEGAALPEKVPRAELGRTGEKIPILVQGCAQRFDPRYDKVLHRLFREGVDYLDTALVYAGGWSHKTIAPFVKQVGREKLWLTSKGPHDENRADPERFQQHLDRCLRQLEVEQLDMFFMHAVKHPKYVSKRYVAMGEQMKRQKKIRFFGFSCHDGNVAELLEKAAALGGGIDCIMFRYNFAQYGNRALNRAIDACKKAGIGLIAMKTQKSVPQDQEEVKAFRSKNFTLAQAKLKAVWADERIDALVSHMDNLKKVEENVAAAKSPLRIGLEEMQLLQRYAARTAAYSCQGCSHHCEPRVAGQTRVADALRFLMYAECYGEAEKARRLWRALRPEERRIDGVDFAAATRACPEGINIEARLRAAQDLLG